jgi:hypothetical protein
VAVDVVGHLVDNLAFPVVATLVATVVIAGARRIRQRRQRRTLPTIPASDPRGAAAADFDAGVALAAAALQRMVEARRFRLNSLHQVRQLADETRDRFSEVGRPYSALRISVDAPLMDHVDRLMSALGRLAEVLQRARRFPVASSRAWASAWDDFEVAQRSFRDVARQQLGASPYRRASR